MPQIMDDLHRNGGGTYAAEDLAPVKPTEGYAVGRGGVSMTLPEFEALGPAGREALMRDLAANLGSNFVGTWLRQSDLTVYVDAVSIISDPQSAWQLAVRENQQEVYDFAAGRSIRPGQITFDQ